LLPFVACVNDRFDRTGEHLVHKDYWQHIKPYLGVSLRRSWEDFGVAAHTFAVSHKAILCLYCQKEDLEAVLNCKTKYESIPHQVKRIIDTSEVGKSMYQHAWLRVSQALFKESIHVALNNLKFLDFEIGSVEAFQTLMNSGVATFVGAGHSLYKKIIDETPFHTTSITVEYETPHDMWHFPYLNQLKSIGIQTGKLPMTQWEDLVYEKGAIDGVPCHGTYPDELFDELRSVRQAVDDYIGPKRLTISQMQKCMNANAKKLKELHPSIACDIAFLNEHVQNLVVAGVRAAILGEFPTATFQPSIAQVTLRI
jgi:hypothetical protein